MFSSPPPLPTPASDLAELTKLILFAAFICTESKSSTPFGSDALSASASCTWYSSSKRLKSLPAPEGPTVASAAFGSHLDPPPPLDDTDEQGELDAGGEFVSGGFGNTIGEMLGLGTGSAGAAADGGSRRLC